MLRDLRPALISVVVITVVLGLAYPLALTGVAQGIFPGKADGSVIERDGKPVGSKLIGQDFSRDTGKKDEEGEPVLAADLDYFQSRPSATGYAPDATFFNNLGPNQKDLAALLKENLAAYLDRERRYTPGLARRDVPVDAVTTSASGVDPQISQDNARDPGQPHRQAPQPRRGSRPRAHRRRVQPAAVRPRRARSRSTCSS